MRHTNTFGLLALAAIALIAIGPPPARAQEQWDDTTVTIPVLRIAVQGEYGARCHYLFLAHLADERGERKLAQCLRAIAWAEGVHVARFAGLLEAKGVREEVKVPGFALRWTPEENLLLCAENEKAEAESIYPYMQELVARAGVAEAVLALDYAISAEHSHELVFLKYGEGLNHPNPGPEVLPIYICTRCGRACMQGHDEQCQTPGCGCHEFKEFADVE